MKILDVFELAIPEVKVIRFARFPDNRGYFSEQYRFSDFETGDAVPFMRGVRFLQANESYSRAGTVRGLHFQWNPYMGKLVRTIRGHMIDVALDVRKGSPTYGKIVAHDMPVQGDEAYAEWIWLPPGFAHGFQTLTDDVELLYCHSAPFNAAFEAGLNAADPRLGIDWPLPITEISARDSRHPMLNEQFAGVQL